MGRRNNKEKNIVKAFKNNMYMLKIAFEACPMKVVGRFVSTVLWYSVIYMFFNIVFLEKIVGFIETGADIETAARFIIISLLIMGAAIIYCCYYNRVIDPVGNQILYEKMHLKMFKKATEVELECFENPDFYKKYTKAASQIKGKAFAVINTLSTMLTVFTNLCFLTYKSIQTDVFILVLVVFPIISTYIIGVKMNKVKYKRYEDNVEYDRKKEYVKRTIYLQDYAKEIRLSNIFNVLSDNFEDAVKSTIINIKKYGVRLVLLNALQSGFSYSFTMGIAVCYAALRLLFWKNISASDFVVLISVIGSFTWNVEDVAKQMTKLQDNSQYISNIKEFMEYEPKISESQPGLKPERHTLSLKMKNVSYTYFGQKEPTLKNINLEIKPGQKIALVGHNGAGKTTLVKLLMRLYDVTEGEITLGDCNIKDYCVRDYRDLFGTVFQDYKVMSLSVAENVLMGSVSKEERSTVINALKNSGVYEKIQTLDNGIDTILTREFDKNGAVLSGGETQKVAIARVFAKDCDFVILDEPSSALDPVAEYHMYESMLEACKDKAIVFISHRLSSAVLADNIYMMENGEIIEHGTHRELIDLNGKYAKMFELQAASYR